MPTPQPAARSNRPIGTALTLAMPVLSTQHSATIVTPSARSCSAFALARSARSAR